MSNQQFQVDKDGAIVLGSGAPGSGGTASQSLLPLSATYTLTSADDAKQYYCTTALTINVPDGLSPRPSVSIDCPPTGAITVQRTGTVALLNGASSALTRTRASNPAGFLILAHQDADSYGVSGS